jgi:hypothetical protein
VLAQYQLPFRPRFISLKVAYALGFMFEMIYFFLPKSWEPPLTRFLALQLGTSHYFSHAAAYRDFAYRPKLTIEEGIRGLK